MKKIVIINPILFLLFIIFFVGGCGNDNKFEKKSGEVSKSILNGLYNVEYEITDTNYIWVVSDDMIYTFYPGSENYINYEFPTYYYIKENKIYICGIGPDWGPVQLSECKNNKT